nr:lisH domain-containing protein C1711.05-like isoform X2 [Monopterus albus]XP_020457827.1 lisH domain-containing protein C1711.05-like isoform X2 [Monopterus albus]
MKVTIITFCLIGAVFANPIPYNVISESSALDSKTSESSSLSQSSENDTSELQSSEENTSDQSSESESLESLSEDKTSVESNDQSVEDDQTDSQPIVETRDNSMGSEENVRKSWAQVFASAVKVLSAEDNSSTEVKGQHLNIELTEKQPTPTSTGNTFKQWTITLQGRTNLPKAESPSDSSDTTSDSSDSSDITAVTAVSSESSESSESTSSESSGTEETSDSSESTEDCDANDSTEMKQIKAKDCVNGTQSCESEEYFFQDIGDDAHFSVYNLMVPNENERELSLRR